MSEGLRFPRMRQNAAAEIKASSSRESIILWTLSSNSPKAITAHGKHPMRGLSIAIWPTAFLFTHPTRAIFWPLFWTPDCPRIRSWQSRMPSNNSSVTLEFVVMAFANPETGSWLQKAIKRPWKATIEAIRHLKTCDGLFLLVINSI